MLVPGLVIVTDFVTEAEESALVSWFGVTKTPSVGIARAQRARVVRYGPGVRHTHYVSGTIDPLMPPELAKLAVRLVEQGLVPPEQLPNAITVNEYQVGQHLTFHADVPRAGAIISTLSLLGDSTLAMLRPKTRISDAIRVEVPHRRRVLVQLTGPCRSPPWLHAIRPVQEPRLSIVFRHGAPATSPR